MQMQEGRCGEYLRTPPEDQSGAMFIAIKQWQVLLIQKW